MDKNASERESVHAYQKVITEYSQTLKAKIMFFSTGKSLWFVLLTIALFISAIIRSILHFSHIVEKGIVYTLLFYNLLISINLIKALYEWLHYYLGVNRAIKNNIILAYLLSLLILSTGILFYIGMIWLSAILSVINLFLLFVIPAFATGYTGSRKIIREEKVDRVMCPNPNCQYWNYNPGHKCSRCGTPFH